MSRNPIYVSTAGVGQHYATLAELLGALCGAGIDRIELGWSPPLSGMVLPQGLSLFPAKWLVHNYFPAPIKPFVLNLAAQNGDILSRSREFAAGGIRLSAALGAPFYSVHCGFLAELDPGSLGRPLLYSEITDYEKGYATFLDSLHYLIAEARAVGIRLLLEPNVVAPFNLINGRNQLLMLAEPHEFARLLSEVPSDHFGILLDLGHLRVSATTLGFNPMEFIDAVRKTVGAFHVHDNDGTSDQHRPIMEGSWILDVLSQSCFAEHTVIVEAKFPNITSVVDHCRWLALKLNH